MSKSGAKKCTWCGVDFTGAPSARRCTRCVGNTPDERMRWNQSIALYGVDKFMFDAMYFEQDGTCLICEEREAVLVDHCHNSGKVRGLLCRGCNTMLGFLENPKKMANALDYLGGMQAGSGDWWR